MARHTQDWPGADHMVPAAHDRATPIAPGVWLSPGLSNSYLVQTDAGRVVINTGMGFEAAVHRRVYDDVDDAPVRYIILTQGHVDHVGGVDVLRDDVTEVVAQAQNARCQSDDARIGRFRVRRSIPYFAAVMGGAVPSGKAPRPPRQARPVPDLLVEERMSLDIGSTRLELLATPGAETVDQLTVWYPGQRIAFVGNLFGALLGHFPNLVTMRGDRYRDPLAIVASANAVLALEPEMLCVGHFGPLVGATAVREEVTRIRDAVQFVHDSTVAGMNAGAKLTDLMQEIRLPEHLQLGEGYGRVDWSVRAIWEMYAGWFKAESTTELYPVPVRDVYDDVVAAAGPDALLAVAESHLQAGRAVHGLHLVEMVLESAPTHQFARSLHQRAHQLLLGSSGNFWETRWLEDQLRRGENEERRA